MALRWIGRGLITIGTLILLFILYELYGTGLITNRYQHQAKKEFQASVRAAEASPGVTPTASSPTTPTDTASPAPVQLPNGAIALMEIPRINLSIIVVEGVSVADLQKGPGHYPGTPLPGQNGNTVISGHRTTYLHPFRNIDQLKAGDQIFITMLSGVRYTYLVSTLTTVLPTAVQVLANTPDNRLTLTTCTPPFSASHRLILVAQLQPGSSLVKPV